jgi:hypothetical protein
MQGRGFRVAGPLTQDRSGDDDTFWIGLWPGLSEEMLFASTRISEFLGGEF